MQNLLNELKSLLATQPRFTQEGRMIKQAVIDAAQSLDVELLQLLISHEAIKRHFFQEVGGILVFDKVKLLRFVSNKAFLEDSYTAFKNKIGLVTKNSDGLYDAYLSDSKEVVLAHPYKDCMLEGGQTKEEEARKEIFWNETLAPDDIDRLKEPKAFSNVKRYDAEGVHENITDLSLNDNFIIKGNNLLALYSLLPVYRGKVKLIYIDPPYGKDADTFYNDTFKVSTWLTFMKNRLQVARELLSQNGLIFIQISYHNLAQLKLICDEIFKSALLNIITVKVRSASGFKVVNPGCFVSSEYILVYSSSKASENLKKLYVEDDYDEAYSKIILNKEDSFDKWELLSLKDAVAEEHGYSNFSELKKKLGYRQSLNIVAEFALSHADKICQLETIGHAAGQESLKLKEISKKERNKVFKTENAKGDDRYVFNGRELAFYSKKLKEFDGVMAPSTLLTDIWKDISWEGIGSEGGVTLNRGKKPERLIQRIIELGSEKGDIVLDFHLGSGTTAAVAHKMGRQFIGIEQLDYEENDSVKRLVNVFSGESTGISKSVNWQGGGSFVYMDIAKANQHFVEQIQTAETEAELLEIWQRMQAEAFISYKVTPDMIDKNQKEYEALSMEDKRRFLIETLDKNLLYVPHCDMESKEFGMSETDKKATTAFYNLKNQV